MSDAQLARQVEQVRQQLMERVDTAEIARVRTAPVWYCDNAAVDAIQLAVDSPLGMPITEAMVPRTGLAIFDGPPITGQMVAASWQVNPGSVRCIDVTLWVHDGRQVTAGAAGKLPLAPMVDPRLEPHADTRDPQMMWWQMLAGLWTGISSARPGLLHHRVTKPLDAPAGTGPISMVSSNDYVRSADRIMAAAATRRRDITVAVPANDYAGRNGNARFAGRRDDELDDHLRWVAAVHRRASRTTTALTDAINREATPESPARQATAEALAAWRQAGRHVVYHTGLEPAQDYGASDAPCPVDLADRLPVAAVYLAGVNTDHIATVTVHDGVGELVFTPIPHTASLVDAHRPVRMPLREGTIGQAFHATAAVPPQPGQPTRVHTMYLADFYGPLVRRLATLAHDAPGIVEAGQALGRRDAAVAWPHPADDDLTLWIPATAVSRDVTDEVLWQRCLNRVDTQTEWHLFPNPSAHEAAFTTRTALAFYALCRSSEQAPEDLNFGDIKALFDPRLSREEQLDWLDQHLVAAGVDRSAPVDPAARAWAGLHGEHDRWHDDYLTS